MLRNSRGSQLSTSAPSLQRAESGPDPEGAVKVQQSKKWSPVEGVAGSDRRVGRNSTWVGQQKGKQGTEEQFRVEQQSREMA